MCAPKFNSALGDEMYPFYKQALSVNDGVGYIDFIRSETYSYLKRMNK